MRRTLSLLVLAGLVAGCAQVPRQSVDLSATVGRDIATVYKAHRELAQILFTRMRSDVNRFVDNVYAPFQIRNAMNRQAELAASQNPDDQKKSLLRAINAAFQPDASPQLQDAVLKGFGTFVRKIRGDVESMRKELLDPLDLQEEEVLGSIDRAYQQLHYANSIVTGHLSSVAKVNETQAELLKAIGVERDLRNEVGATLAMTSSKISALVETAATADDKLTMAQKQAEQLKNAIIEFETKLQKKNKGD